MLQFACGVFLLQVAIVAAAVSFEKPGMVKRNVCPPGGGDQLSGCQQWKNAGFCNKNSAYYDFASSTCPATCGLCAETPTVPPIPEPVAVEEFECLASHNAKRALHATSNLKWDANLAKGSQVWSIKLANDISDGPVQLIHSTGRHGENLYYYGTTAGTVKGCKDAVKSWYSEIRDYDWNNPGTSKGGQIGHFTQVVWKNTAKVGCGVAKLNKNHWTHTIVTCRYSPPGNYRGQYADNVPAPV